MNEVYERLKFLTRECFHSSETNQVYFERILKELDLYINSYENDNEDSDWDSDEECVAITIVTSLK